VTHNKYGTRRIPEIEEIFRNLKIVKTIDIHNKTIITSPPEIECIPKKTIDQSKLRISWTTNRVKAGFTKALPVPSFQTRNNEIAIIMYNVVQTGANNQLGGLNSGLFNVAYQPGIASAVSIEPINPAARQATTLITNLRILDIMLVDSKAFFENQFSKKNYIPIVCQTVLISTNLPGS
jgi:hypothetical protein